MKVYLQIYVGQCILPKRKYGGKMCALKYKTQSLNIPNPQSRDQAVLTENFEMPVLASLAAEI